MRRLKRLAILLITAFLVFAPPGTLIFIFIVVLGVVGDVWIVVGVTLAIALVAAAWLLARRRADRRSERRSVVAHPATSRDRLQPDE